MITEIEGEPRAIRSRTVTARHARMAVPDARMAIPDGTGLALTVEGWKSRWG